MKTLRTAAANRLLLVTGALLAASAPAQSFRDLTMVRARPSSFAEVLQFRGGVLGSIAGDEDESIGLENNLGWDAHAYYRNDRFADREALLELYAGRDGALVNVLEGNLLGGGSQSRLEAHVRYFPFYREGFYRDGDFIPTGRYEGLDYGAGLYVGRELDQGLRIEFGVFYRRNDFDENEDTAPNFTIPDTYNAYGGRLFLEHSTMVLDRITGRPREGGILTLAGEREQNDSDRTWGTSGIWQSQLPSGLWRARGHVELYFPQSETGFWEIEADASLSDRDDRVYNYDAQKPIGDLWIDGEVRYRLELGTSFAVTPFGKGQFVRVAKESGVSSENEFFFGGGVNAVLDFGDSLSLLGSYSYLSNESREPVAHDEDTFGEHRFFFGLQARFGGRRR